MYEALHAKDAAGLNAWIRKNIGPNIFGHFSYEHCTGFDGEVLMKYLDEDFYVLAEVTYDGGTLVSRDEIDDIEKYTAAKHADTRPPQIHAIHLIPSLPYWSCLPWPCELAPYKQIPGTALWTSQLLYRNPKLPPLTFVFTLPMFPRFLKEYQESSVRAIRLGGIGESLDCWTDDAAEAFAHSRDSELWYLRSLDNPDMPGLTAYSSMVESVWNYRIFHKNFYTFTLRSGAPDAPESFVWQLKIAAARLSGKRIPHVGDIIRGRTILYGETDALHHQLLPRPEPRSLSAQSVTDWPDHQPSDSLPAGPGPYPPIAHYGNGILQTHTPSKPTFTDYASYRRQMPKDLRPCRAPARSVWKKTLDSLIDYLPDRNDDCLKYCLEMTYPQWTYSSPAEERIYFWFVLHRCSVDNPEPLPIHLLVTADRTGRALYYTLHDGFTPARATRYGYTLTRRVSETDTPIVLPDRKALLQELRSLRTGESLTLCAGSRLSRFVATCTKSTPRNGNCFNVGWVLSEYTLRLYTDGFSAATVSKTICAVMHQGTSVALTCFNRHNVLSYARQEGQREARYAYLLFRDANRQRHWIRQHRCNPKNSSYPEMLPQDYCSIKVADNLWILLYRCAPRAIPNPDDTYLILRPIKKNAPPASFRWNVVSVQPTPCCGTAECTPTAPPNRSPSLSATSPATKKPRRSCRADALNCSYLDSPYLPAHSRSPKAPQTNRRPPPTPTSSCAQPSAPTILPWLFSVRSLKKKPPSTPLTSAKYTACSCVPDQQMSPTPSAGPSMFRKTASDPPKPPV